MPQLIRNTIRRINGIGNGVRSVLKPRSLSMAYYRNREANTEILKLPRDGLGSDNTQQESTFGAVFPNVGDSSTSLVEREKSGLERSFFKKEKPEEVVSESENNLPTPIV